MANLYNQTHRSMVFGEQGPENVVTDIHQVKQWAVNRYPQLPYFMMGHSMGSFALRNYLQDYPVTVQGVIFMGTGTSPLPLTAALPLLKNGRETAEKPAPFIDKLAFGSFSKNFLKQVPLIGFLKIKPMWLTMKMTH